MSNFRPIDRDTDFLLPPSVDEWLPERHLARFVVEVIAGLDLRAMTGSYRGSGEASYHPRLLLGIMIYGYATGVFSSRKLERATYDKRQLEPMLDKIADLPEGLGEVGELLADNGYFSEANVNACAAAGIDPVIAMGREAHHPSLDQRFADAPPPLQQPPPLEAMDHRLKTPVSYTHLR